MAALASSPEAAAAFDAIRSAWSDRQHTTPAELRAMTERFIDRFPRDGRVPVARIALAIEAMASSDFATADTQLALTAGVAPGTTRNLWTVACARRLRLRKDPDAAVALLRPLVGKSVDAMVLFVFQEEVTLTALATHRDYEAVSYMDAWLRSSTEEEKAEAIRRVTDMVQGLPREVLVGALQAMRAQRTTFGYGVDIERILAERLVQMATTSGDAELARMLLDTDPEAIATAGDAGAKLGELATSRRGLNVVEGRTVGLLLPTEAPGLRDESADVLRGVMWSLGLPRGARTPGRTSPGDAGAASAGGACAPLEPAPDLDEPRPEEGLRLVTRDDAGNVDRTDVSLDELAGEGAAVVIAALDGQTAERALKWSDDHGVPLIALAAPVSPGSSPRQGPFGFVLGEGRATVLGALLRGAPSLAGAGVTVAPVVDSSEVTLYAPQGGPFGGLTFGPPIPCDIPSVRAGDPRFPVAQWAGDRTHAWLISGSLDCAVDVLAELSAAHARGAIALTLEAAGLPSHGPGLRVTTVRAGVVPEIGPADPRDEELRRFSATLGRIGWWSAIGRDAAALARATVLNLPTDSVSEAHAVAERRAMARDRLAIARARLWTSEASGWAADHTMKRALCTVDVPAR